MFPDPNTIREHTIETDPVTFHYKQSPVMSPNTKNFENIKTLPSLNNHL